MTVWSRFWSGTTWVRSSSPRSWSLTTLTTDSTGTSSTCICRQVRNPSSCILFLFDVKNCGESAVWPDWAYFGNSWQQILLPKVPQIFSDFLGICESVAFKSNWLGYFLGNFWKNLGYFLFQHLTGNVAREQICPAQDYLLVTFWRIGHLFLTSGHT